MYKIALFSFFFFSVTNLLAQTRRYYVDPAAFGQNSGQTWYDAFTNLHDALAIAVKGDEIWVAQGIYRPTDGNDRNAHYELLSGVRLLGGFAGTEMDVSERDIEAHPSILDGDIGMPGDSTDNTYNLLYMYRPDIETVLDGFVFQNALADKPGITNGFPGVSGAAIYVMATDGTAYPTIANCNFFHNIALKDGGAIYANGSGEGSIALYLNRCKFLFNQSLNGNGGAYARLGGSWIDQKADIKDCLFENNFAYSFGGGIFFSDSPRVDTFDIIGTEAKFNSCNGNGILSGSFFHVIFSRPNIPTVIRFKKCKIENNKTSFLSVALVSQVFFAETGNTLWVMDSVLFKNNATPIAGESFGWINYCLMNTVFEGEMNGIGNYASQSLKVSDSSTILKNVKMINCGKLYSSNECSFFSKKLIIDGLTLENNITLSIGINSLQNESKIEAQNILAFKNSGWNSISPVSFFTKNSNNNSFINVYNLNAFKNLVYLVSPNTTIKNSIFHINDPKLLNKFPPNNQAIVKNSIITLPDTISNLNWIQSNNLWSTDPMFVSPDSGDFHLQACSPAINAGLNDGNLSTKDLLGQPRVQFGTVDIGAIEAGPLQQYAPAETTPACNSESANGSIRFSTVDLCAPATYNWSTGASGIELNKQSGLMPGNYQVTITDSKGRIGVFALEVPLGLAMHLKVASDPLVCGDTIGGRLSVQVEGSNSGPYQYNWGFSSDSVVSGLPAGLYQVTVIDAQGCTSSATASVQKTGALDLALDLVPISCNGTADGSLTILPANGKAPFSWLWSDGANTPTRGALGPGIYQGVLTDAFDCKIQWYLPLTEPDVLQINAQVNAASGPQIADGSLLLDNVSGGTKPYSPVWSNGQSGLQISGLLPGTYTCTLTDANGCSVIRTFEVPFVSATRDWIQESGFKIYPNPNQGVFTLEGRGLGQMQFELLDETGRTVLSYNLEAPVGSKFYYAMQTNLPSGPYHWHVLDANGRVAQGNMTVFH